MTEMRRYVWERPKRSSRPCARATQRALRPSAAASSERGSAETTGRESASTGPEYNASDALGQSARRSRACGAGAKAAAVDLACGIARQLGKTDETCGHLVARDPRAQE